MLTRGGIEVRKIFIKGRLTREGRGVSQKTIADQRGGYELLFLADVICEHSAPKGAKTVGQKYVDMQ